VTAATTAGPEDTFPKLILRNARVRPGRTAIRHKDLGIWQSWTWAEVAETVRAYAAGLAALGLQRGNKIAVVGNNRPRLYWTMEAAQWLGAVPVPGSPGGSVGSGSPDRAGSGVSEASGPSGPNGPSVPLGAGAALVLVTAAGRPVVSPSASVVRVVPVDAQPVRTRPSTRAEATPRADLIRPGRS